MDRATETYENIELFVLPGEGHIFTPEGGITAISKAIDFIMVN